MAYETGVPSSMNDLMDKLETFASANGWTTNRDIAESGGTDGELSLERSGTHVHFLWNSSEADHIAMYHSLGYDVAGGIQQWQHTDDSGNSANVVPGTDARWQGSSEEYRHIRNIGAGPYTKYHFFEDSGTGYYYIHCVLEMAPLTFRHFGFGLLDKSWDWTGGEYVYAHVQRTGSASGQEILLASNGSASSGSAKRLATIHAEGLPNQPAASKWGTFASLADLNASWSDRAGEFQVRFQGGAPGGPLAAVFNNVPSNSGDGFLPMTPVAVWYRDTVATPDNIYFMGFQKDVRTLNTKNIAASTEVSVAGNTWVVFPSVRRQDLGATDESENLGIAYKKVT